MDGLRAAAALAVVMIHVSAGQTTDAELVWNQLSRFAVPMFLVLTGFGHAGALTEGKFEPQGWTAVRRRRPQSVHLSKPHCFPPVKCLGQHRTIKAAAVLP